MSQVKLLQCNGEKYYRNSCIGKKISVPLAFKGKPIKLMSIIATLFIVTVQMPNSVKYALANSNRSLPSAVVKEEFKLS